MDRIPWTTARARRRGLIELEHALRSWCATACRETDFSLILLAAPASVVVGDPVFDREDVVNEIADLQRTDGGAELSSTLAEIERVLDRVARREPRLRERRVFFFTDLGRTTWGDVSSNATQAALAPSGGQGRSACGRRR